MNNQNEIGIGFARNYFLPFCIATNNLFQVSTHHKKIANALMDIESRKINRLLICMPPRHGKSWMTSYYFPAWVLGRNPLQQIIFTSYEADIASGWGRKVRNLINEPIYGKIFPECVLSDDSQASKSFATKCGGEFHAVGAGGALTSRGGDIIIIDDIVKNRLEANSLTYQKRNIDWYKSTLYTRLMPNGAIIIIGTRWHENDLIGHIINSEGEKWHKLILPAIDDNNNALWPERWPIDELLQIKGSIGEMEFQSLYQQSPSMQQGNIIKREWLRFYKELPPKFETEIQSWDCSFKGNDDNDYVAGLAIGKIGAKKYIIDLLHKRMGFVETVKSIKEFSARYPKTYSKYIEDKANGSAVIDYLQSQITGLIPFNPDCSKIERLNIIAPQIQAGDIIFPDPNIFPWAGEIIEELVNFPNYKNDDIVDAMTQGIISLGINNYLDKLLTQ